MLRPAAIVAAAALAWAPAHADPVGFYFSESVGVGISHDELAQYIGGPMHVRVGVGVRWGDLAVEPWVLSDLTTERDGAFRGIVGGDPAMGSADLASYGVDLKYIMPVDKRLSFYVRGGPIFASANGALDGYLGNGFGFGGGVQISGQVRALGFLWSPLFFLKKGPKITGALYLDEGYDFYWLQHASMPTLTARMGHVSVGFALGSRF